MKQILNIDSDSFSTTVLQDVQEIRIQESDQFENSVQPLSNYPKKISFNYPTYFEYSMGGNLKFYKEHLQQDIELENKVYSVKNPRQRLRKPSHSDNDSEPEALRYACKPQEKVTPVVNTIAEEPELSFDDYSSIYQPEFMLNINSKSLVKEIPKIGLRDRVNNKEMKDRRRTDKHKIASWSQDLIEDSPPENVMENLEVHVVSKPNDFPAAKQNVVLTNHEDMFDYHSSSAKTKRHSKRLENQEIEPVQNTSKGNQGIKLVQDKSKGNQEMKSVQDKSRGNEEMKPVKIDKNKVGTKNKTVSLKTRQPKTIQGSDRSNVAEDKNILSKENSSAKKKNIVNHITPSSLKKAKSKKESKDRAKKTTERTEIPKKLIQTKQLDNNYESICFKDTAANNETCVKPQDDFVSRLSIDTILDNTDLFEELGKAAEKKLSESKPKKDAEFYPESPVSELHFFKTPCSTRHNSLETFEQLESECIQERDKQVRNMHFGLISTFKVDDRFRHHSACAVEYSSGQLSFHRKWQNVGNNIVKQ